MDSAGSCSTSPAWWVFRLRGVEITDWALDLDDPMFVDATLVSFGSLGRAILENESIIARHGGSIDSVRQGLDAWGWSNQTEFSAFIAVRRSILFDESGPILHSPPPELQSKVKELQVAAEQRASEIATALSLVFMRDVGLVYTSCGLERVVPDPPSLKDGVVDFETGLLSFTVAGSPYPYLHPGVTQTTREELVGRVRESRFADLCEIILWPSKKLRKAPLRRVIVQAVDRLARALFAVDSSERLLGAVTAIEILLATGRIGYERIKDRLVALLGHEVGRALKASDVFDARHKYVHEGKRFEVGLADQAVRLAAAALNIYVTVSEEIGDKDSIGRYLDFRCRCDELLEGDAGFLREHLKALPFHPHPKVEVE